MFSASGIQYTPDSHRPQDVGVWFFRRDSPPVRHPEVRQSPVEIVVEGLHQPKRLRRAVEERLPVGQLPVSYGVLQIPALVLQIGGLGVVPVVPGGHVFQRCAAQRKMGLEVRRAEDRLPLLAVGGDVVPHHPGGVLEHIGKQTAAQEGLIARLDLDVAAHGDGQLTHGGDVGPEGGVIGGFIPAEPGVPHQLEGQFPGLMPQDGAVKVADPEDQRADQGLKLRGCLLVFGLMRVIPCPVIVVPQVRQVAQDHPYICHVRFPHAFTTAEKAGPSRKSRSDCRSVSGD